MSVKSKKTLPDIIREYLELPGNSETRIAQKSNFNIKQSSVNDLKNGRVQSLNATVSTIYWLAKGMEKRPFEVFCAALGITAKEFGIRDSKTEIISEVEIVFSKLPLSRQKDVMGIMQYFLGLEKAEEPTFSPDYQQTKEEYYEPNYENSLDKKKKVS